MKFKTIKILFTVLLAFFYAPNLSAAEDVDWSSAKESIYENGAGTAIIGTRWAIGSRRDNVQITFRLEAQTDMINGGWLGDIRAPEKFYVKIYLVDENDNKNFLNVKNSKVLGPDTYLGRWKDGPTTSPEQMLMYDFSWDELILVKNSKAIILNYALYDSPEDVTDITFPLASFNALLDKIEADIKSVDGGRAYVMTKEEMDNTPLEELPLIYREASKVDLQRISEDLSIPEEELVKLTKSEIQLKIRAKNKAIKEARLAETRAKHQAIYDQEPNWLDMNICPKPDVEFCNNIGHFAYEDNQMFSDLTIGYGKILGVVWRSEGSISHVYGGSAEYNLDPKIVRTSKAAYYYIVKDGEGPISIRACNRIDTRS